jgi:hypothetical protein
MKDLNWFLIIIIIILLFALAACKHQKSNNESYLADYRDYQYCACNRPK